MVHIPASGSLVAGLFFADLHAGGGLINDEAKMTQLDGAGRHMAPSAIRSRKRPGEKGHRCEGVMSGAGTSVDREVRVDRHAGAVAVPSRGGSA